MDEYYSVIQFLPEPLRTELKAMPPERAARVQEIRLRAGQAGQFTVGGAWQPAQQLLPAAQTALAIGPRLQRRCGIRNPLARGLALGSAAHGIGTARAIELGAVEGALSGLAMALMGIGSALLVPLFEKFCY